MRGSSYCEPTVRCPNFRTVCCRLFCFVVVVVVFVLVSVFVLLCFLRFFFFLWAEVIYSFHYLPTLSFLDFFQILEQFVFVCFVLFCFVFLMG